LERAGPDGEVKPDVEMIGEVKPDGVGEVKPDVGEENGDRVGDVIGS